MESAALNATRMNSRLQAPDSGAERLLLLDLDRRALSQPWGAGVCPGAKPLCVYCLSGTILPLSAFYFLSLFS